jgi:hypothetical protein
MTDRRPGLSAHLIGDLSVQSTRSRQKLIEFFHAIGLSVGQGVTIGQESFGSAPGEGSNERQRLVHMIEREPARYRD